MDQRVIVVGAGVVGLMTAYALKIRGIDVVLLDAATPGRESSWAGGGIIGPVPPWRYDPWVEQTICQSQMLWAAWLADIERRSGVACEYQRSGLLLSGHPDHHNLVAEASDWVKETERPFVLGHRANFDKRLPNQDWPAILLPDVYQIRNPRLIQALGRALLDLGVTIITDSPISRVVHSSGNQLTVKAIGGQSYLATHVVIAAGAWTDDILKASGLAPLGISPKRGQMLLYRLAPRDLPAHIINTGQGYLIPRADGHLLVGSTVEDVGYDYRPSEHANRQLMEVAQTTWPHATPDNLVQQWTGFRPGFGEGRPSVGLVDKKKPGLWINAGHYRNGLGLAPACADHLASAMFPYSSPNIKPNR